MKNLKFAVLAGVWSVAVVLAARAQSQTVVFNFDTNAPALTIGQNVAFDQTADGVSAHFSSPQGAVLSIQTDGSTGYTLSQFSGRYLMPNNQNRNVLDILFSQWLTNISLTFATTDFPPIETPTPILLTAYLGSTNTPAVGSQSAQAVYGTDTMPMGTVTFGSTQPFNLVEIYVPSTPGGSAGVLIDNIVVTAIPIPEPTSVALLGLAGGLFAVARVVRRRRGVPPTQ